MALVAHHHRHWLAGSDRRRRTDDRTAGDRDVWPCGAQLSELFHHRRRDRRVARRIAELFRLSRSATTCPREYAAPAACTEEKINEHPRPQRHPPEGHHRGVARLTQGLFAAR